MEKLVKSLKSVGADPTNGLQLCDNDISMFLILMGIYLEDSREHIDLARKALIDLDTYNFRIQMCGLKNTIRVMGFDELSKEFRDYELVCCVANIEISEFDATKKRFEDTMNKLEDILGDEWCTREMKNM